eukprot:CAMPEP_0117550904 /NCGR_PEP_ID=MMETSP0784-20121206/48918_1 /TAXON_ID=39447 /ORGANISM="" /LENGTH=309 /DNA_ID=CAMNT_0005347931 /DNA_START=15 /DNA_END=944 /DNA_ORIENTATION=-
MADALMGSPSALLRLHRMLLLEAIATVLLFAVLPVVFLVSFSESKREVLRKLMVVVAVPIVAAGLRMPVVLRMQRRCRQLATAFETQNAAVATGMVQMLQSGSSKLIQAMSIFMTVWYLFAVTWVYVGPLCSQYAEPIRFWRLQTEALPCEVFECVCTLLLMTNATLGALLFAAPVAVRHFQGNFLPDRCRGLPVNLLQQLPSHIFTVGEDPQPTCGICIDPLREGEEVRRLPCNHCFHKDCVDAWLVRSATCPMRCPMDLWNVVDRSAPEHPRTAEAARLPNATTLGRAEEQPDRAETPPDRATGENV